MASTAGDAVTPESIEMMEERERLKHTLGNLTLVTGSLNPAMGKAGWGDKKHYLARSLLTLNRGVCDAENWQEWGLSAPLPVTWNEITIESRSRFLADQINRLWSIPSVNN